MITLKNLFTYTNFQKDFFIRLLDVKFAFECLIFHRNSDDSISFHYDSNDSLQLNFLKRKGETRHHKGVIIKSIVTKIE